MLNNNSNQGGSNSLNNIFANQNPPQGQQSTVNMSTPNNKPSGTGPGIFSNQPQQPANNPPQQNTNAQQPPATNNIFGKNPP